MYTALGIDKIEGFPLIEELSKKRHDLFEQSHDLKLETNKKIAAWFAHKGLSVISLPANSLGTIVGTAGFLATATTLGTFKVLVFAGSLGNVELTFPTGAPWFGWRALRSAAEIGSNVFEFSYDAYSLCRQAVRGVKWVGQKLKIDGIVNAIFKNISKSFDFAIDRLTAGIQFAADKDTNFIFSKQVADFFNFVNKPTAASRINLDKASKDRSFTEIGKHTALSVANIPLHVVGTGLGVIATGVNFAGWSSKVIIKASTGLELPIPTCLAQSFEATMRSGSRAFADIGSDIGDVFVLVYKTAEATGLTKAVKGALAVIEFIPTAIFGK